MVHISLVAITKDGSPIVGNAQGEVPDPIALLVIVHKSAVIEALSDLIDQESDDAAARSQRDREKKLTEIGRDGLRVEREEAALV